MSGLSTNMKAAEEAVAHVKTTLPLGAGNVMQDFVKSKGASYTCANRLRASYPAAISHGRQTDDWIEYVAEAAEKAGCGNCTEQCVIAIRFLLRNTPISSLDYLAFDPSRGFDHQFLAIGRDYGTNLARPADWGLNAVVCDPWQPEPNRRVYHAYEAWCKMPFLPNGGHTIQSLGRWGV